MPNVMLNAVSTTASTTLYYVFAGLLVLLVLLGISLMSRVEQAAKGNALGSVSMLAMIVLTLWYFNIFSVIELWIAMLIGTVIGVVMMLRVKMIQMPQMVGLLNGFGGAASMLAGLLTLLKAGGDTTFSLVTAGLAVAVGSLTFFGSLIAAGKLHGVVNGRSVKWPGHTVWLYLSLLLSIALIVVLSFLREPRALLVLLAIVLAVVSGAFGVLFSIRVGGADMPITISLLNSFSGVAGSIAGMAIADPLLVAVGGVVGASGLLLTRIMCRAMNRSLLEILLGNTSGAKTMPKAEAVMPFMAETAVSSAAAKPCDPCETAASVLKAAHSVVIVPGYGMAIAQAQHLVKRLSDDLSRAGTETAFGIHPVAGRMPGHMNVLLAEADVPYDLMLDMEAANERFSTADVVVVIGANDVINPAAQTAEGTPIYGMPILEVNKAKRIIVLNYDDKPGYAGVDNPLYRDDSGKVVTLFGDAAETLQSLLDRMVKAEVKEDLEKDAVDHVGDAASALKAAHSVVIVPGYGMAIAQAQHLVKRLSDDLSRAGAATAFGIHPVAGRMPGHMNVLLAEADVPYDLMLDMEAANERFSTADVVVVIGANDVINPAAQTAEGTPIYGMPILEVDKAKRIIVLNYDDKPGYAGVDNPLYRDDSGKVVTLFGDAAETLQTLLDRMARGDQEVETGQAADHPVQDAASALKAAHAVVIVPGYGMAIAQAQHLVKRLNDDLVRQGKETAFGIHPVAGRMPGHMNVLLAEADVPYDLMLEMDAANAKLRAADAVVIIGANDVVNPAAQTAEGTPIYGMPILEVDKAKRIIVLNYDDKPGYAGVDNPLYRDNSGKVVTLFGDAAETLEALVRQIEADL